MYVTNRDPRNQAIFGPAERKCIHTKSKQFLDSRSIIYSVNDWNIFDGKAKIGRTKNGRTKIGRYENWSMRILVDTKFDRD